MSKLSRWAVHVFTALGMLAVTLIVLWFVLAAGSNLPVVGGLFAWTGQHASGSAEGF